MSTQRTAAVRGKDDGRRITKTTSGSCNPTPPADQPRDRVLAVLRAAYRAAREEQDAVAEHIVLIAGIGRAVESGACDPSFALAREVDVS